MVYKPYTSHIPSNYKYWLIYNIGGAPTLYYVIFHGNYKYNDAHNY